MPRFNVLNEALYIRLRSHFGAVKVASPGQAMIAHTVRDYLSGELRLEIEQAGEYYRISCPYCTDTRFRLYISYRYGQNDDAGRPMTYTAICYNEGCLDDYANRQDLWLRLNEIPGILSRAYVRKGVELPAEARIKTMPGPCVPVHKLPPTHPAASYLISRKFDPGLLGRFYGVSYCQQSIYYLAAKRLIIPTFMHGKLVGWQGRYVGELPWKDPARKRELPPKYYTCPGMDRRYILGNFDVARRFHTGVLVEGWFDVFGFGPMAMCVFGATLTEQQRREFLAAFGQRSAVFLIDPEAFDTPTTRRTIRLLRDGMSGNLVVVRLPRGTDPGSLDREYLRHYVEVQAAEQGVTVSWGRVV